MSNLKNPNAQNIPIRTERGRRIREAFMDAVPKVHGVDYEKLEQRILETVKKDPQ